MLLGRSSMEKIIARRKPRVANLFPTLNTSHRLEFLFVPAIAMLDAGMILTEFPTPKYGPVAIAASGIGTLTFYIFKHIYEVAALERKHAKKIAALTADFERRLSKTIAQHEAELVRHNQLHEAEVARIDARHRSAARQLEKRHIEELKAVLQSMMNHPDQNLTCVGGLREAFDWLKKLIDGAEIISVTNMAYRRVELVERILPDGYQHFYRWIRHLCRNGAVWQDLGLLLNGSTALCPLDTFIASLNAAERLRYEAKQIFIPFPLPQVTVIRLANDRKAVCVGYDYEDCNDPLVFVSFHPDVVRYWEGWLMNVYHSKNATTVFPPPLAPLEERDFDYVI
jgi:hypothetical protein